MTQQYKGSFLVMVSAVLFGCMPLAAKIVYQNGGNPITLTFLRNTLALPALYIIMRLNKGDCAVNRGRLAKLIILSLGYAPTPLLLYSSYHYISSGTATTIHFIYPVFVVLGCIVFFKEPANRIKIVCVFLCTVGILLFYSPSEQGSLLGLTLAFASGITFAFYLIYLDKIGLTSMAPYALIFWLALVSAIEVGLYGLCARDLSFSMTASGWLLSLVFSLGVTVCAAVCLQTGVKMIGPQRAAILSTLEPITSILLGLLFFSEPFGIRTGFGVALILASVLVLTCCDKEAKSMQSEPPCLKTLADEVEIDNPQKN